MLDTLEFKEAKPSTLLQAGAVGKTWPTPRPESRTAADRKAFLAGGLIVADFVAVLASAVGAYAYRFDTTDLPFTYLLFAGSAALLLVNIMQLIRGYAFSSLEKWPAPVSKIMLGWAAVALLMIAIAYFLKISEAVSRIWITTWFLGGAAMLLASRIVAAAVIFRWRHANKLTPRIAVVGAAARIAGLTSLLTSSPDSPVHVIPVILDGAREEAGSSRVFDELAWLSRSNSIDEIVIAPATEPQAALEPLIQRLKTLAVNVKVYPEVFDTLTPIGRLETLCGMPMLSVVQRPLAGWPRFAKRIEDILLSAVAIAFFSPIMLMIALAIKLDSLGPVLFCQTRYGYNGTPICIYKFRTMRVESGRDGTAPQAKRDDARVTKIGRFLRKVSLDELPQLFNVLLGDMSLVGPRPHPVALNEKFETVIGDYLARHRVKPGITGWAQVNGLRGETETLDKMQRRVEYDLYYISHWSLLFDLRIMFWTIFVGMVNRNAY